MGSVYFVVKTAVEAATEGKLTKGRKKLSQTTLPPKVPKGRKDAKRVKNPTNS